MSQAERSIYTRCIEVWGIDSQINMALEEMGELITALCHLRRGRIDTVSVASEIADVEVMLGQIMTAYPEIEAEVEGQKQYKLERLARRVKEAEDERRMEARLAG